METAADRFGLPPERLLGRGMIAGPDGAPSVSYGELVSGQRRVERVPADAPVRGPADWRVAGRSAARPARRPLSGRVTGAKQFPADLRPARHAAWRVLRPPSHGAALVSADTTAASAVPGVTVVRDGSFVGVVAPPRKQLRRRGTRSRRAGRPRPGMSRSRSPRPAWSRGCGTIRRTATGCSAVRRDAATSRPRCAPAVRLDASYSAALHRARAAGAAVRAGPLARRRRADGVDRHVRRRSAPGVSWRPSSASPRHGCR